MRLKRLQPTADRFERPEDGSEPDLNRAENIYDGGAGRFILIPQGSKLVGTYANSVTTGQQRVLVAWSRIILPDNSSIDPGRMPGTDQSGLAGLSDR